MIQWAILSDCGSREINEDSVGIYQSEGKELFVVADGLGGHGKGDIASKIAVDCFKSDFENSSGSLTETMAKAFDNAQEAILAEQKRTGSLFQMKTTACAVAMENNTVVWGHIGDSRVYSFSRNKVKERTLDHSVPQMLVLAKSIKEKEIRNHPDRNKLLRVLGVSGDILKFEISEPQSIYEFQAFLLCSDGFWELILEKEMCSLLKKSKTVEEWLEKMGDIVRKRGAGTDMDNFSAIAIWV